jgi:hypothetical protein
MSNILSAVIIIYILLRWLFNFLVQASVIQLAATLSIALCCSIIGIPLGISILLKYEDINGFLQKYFSLEITNFLVFRIALEAEINESSE